MNALMQPQSDMTTDTTLPSDITERPSALVIVDAQNGFITAAAGGQKALDYIHQLLDASRFDVVVATQFINPENSPFRRVLDYHGMSAGKTSAQLDKRIAERADYIITKYGYSVDTLDIYDSLHVSNIDSALVVGFDTDACVLATAFSLFDAGIVPVIDSRGCASGGGIAAHEAALAIATRSLRVV